MDKEILKEVGNLDGKKIAREFERFERRSKELEEIAKKCEYLKEPNYVSIPAVNHSCTHPDNKFGVCGDPDYCPILKAREKGGTR